MHNPEADGTSKDCLRDLAGRCRPEKGTLSHGALFTKLIILVKERKEMKIGLPIS